MPTVPSMLCAMQAAVHCLGYLVTIYGNNDTGSNPLPIPPWPLLTAPL